MKNDHVPIPTVRLTEGGRAILLTPEQKRCLDAAEPIVRAIVARDLPGRESLAHKLAVAGWVAWKEWQFDPSDRAGLEKARAALRKLERAWTELSPAAHGGLAAGGAYRPDFEKLTTAFNDVHSAPPRQRRRGFFCHPIRRAGAA